jgi:cell division protein YceG involved in septum cleavage
MELPKKRNLTRSHTLRYIIWAIVFICILCALTLIVLLQSKVSLVATRENTTSSEPLPILPPFPIGVDPQTELIVENPTVDEYVARFVASNHTAPRLGDSLIERAITKLAELDWYQNLATPATRILIIQSGERHEEVVRNFARILQWDETEQTIFTDILRSEVPVIYDGKLYPGRYIVATDADPESVAIAVADRFNAEVRTRYSNEIADTVSLEDALIIASLIEREAYDFTDMRYISGVIWNRLFIEMPLQIDATLQYAKAGVAGPTRERGWWPLPRPADKYIESEYNTYAHKGLPPAPIANPSIDAIIAALNPKATDCLFYFHTDDGTFYCNTTYEDHVAGLKEHFGAGR